MNNMNKTHYNNFIISFKVDELKNNYYNQHRNVINEINNAKTFIKCRFTKLILSEPYNNANILKRNSISNSSKIIADFDIHNHIDDYQKFDKSVSFFCEECEVFNTIYDELTRRC